MAYPEKTVQSILNKGWGAWEGIREFYQNVLDEEEAVHGVPNVYTGLDSYGLWIWDYGRGIRAIDWFGRMGEEREERKHWWDRGRFGRGMKDGAAALIIHTGKPIFIWTRYGYVYTLYFGNWYFAGETRRCLVITAREGAFEMPIPGAGTVVLVYGYKGDTFLDRFNIPVAKKNILAKIEYSYREAPEKPNYIIDEPEKRIYVRNIFVNQIKTLFGRPSLYSYDLWWIELDEDRRTVDRWSFERELGRLLSRLPLVNLPLWTEILKNIATRDFVESHANFTYDYLYGLEEPVYKSWLNAFGANAICLSPDEGTFFAERLKYLGYVPIVVPWESLRRFLLNCRVPSLSPGIGVVNGIIYVIGGRTDTFASTVNEAYDPATNTWSTKASMPTGRLIPASAVVNDIIYVIGGQTDSTTWTNVNQAYDPATNTWSSKASMPTPRGGSAVGVINNII